MKKNILHGKKIKRNKKLRLQTNMKKAFCDS